MKYYASQSESSFVPPIGIHCSTYLLSPPANQGWNSPSTLNLSPATGDNMNAILSECRNLTKIFVGIRTCPGHLYKVKIV